MENRRLLNLAVETGLAPSCLRHITCGASETRQAASLPQQSSRAIEAVRAQDVHLHYAPVAQLDRAAASGAVGREFESLRARQTPSRMETPDQVQSPLSRLREVLTNYWIGDEIYPFVLRPQPLWFCSRT